MRLEYRTSGLLADFDEIMWGLYGNADEEDASSFISRRDLRAMNNCGIDKEGPGNYTSFGDLEKMAL